MNGDALPGLSRTAVWVAGMRAAESGRPDPLYDDPYAAVFVTAAHGDTVPPDAVPPAGNDFVAIRTRFFDDQALAATGAGIRQVVVLAAGLDARAFRLPWPDGVHLFEVDVPGLFAFKEPVLRDAAAVPGCDRHVVGTDLRDPWSEPLTGAGFDPAAPAGWLVEGLMPYLDHDATGVLLARLTALSAPGSRVVLDHIDGDRADATAMRGATRTVTTMGGTLNTAREPVSARLTGHGWTAADVRLPELRERYARPWPPGTDLRLADFAVFTTAVRP